MQFSNKLVMRTHWQYSNVDEMPTATNKSFSGQNLSKEELNIGYLDKSNLKERLLCHKLPVTLIKVNEGICHNTKYISHCWVWSCSTIDQSE